MQKINLYVTELRPVKEWLTFATVVGSSVLSVVLFSLVAWGYNVQINRLALQVKTLEEQKLDLTQRLTKFSVNLNNHPSKDVDQEISRLQNAITERQLLSSLIKNHRLGNEKGFSPYLESLALHSSSNLSLEHFMLALGGNYFEMQGLARNAESVPNYMAKLKAETTFAHTMFGEMHLQRAASSQNASSIVQFSLGNIEQK